MAQIKFGQAVHGRRRGKKALPIAPNDQIFAVIQGRQQPGSLGPAGGELIVRGTGAGLPPGIHDRPIAGAAAQVAGQAVVHPGPVRRAVLVIQGKQAHHDARRTKAALAAVVAQHGCLHGVQITRPAAKVLDRNKFLAVDHAQQLYAGINRLVSHLAVPQAAQGNGASAAIAFRATFLGAEGIPAQAQIIQQGFIGANLGQFNNRAPMQKFYRPPHHVLAAPVGGIAMRRQQQGHMIMGRRVRHAKADGNHVQE